MHQNAPECINDDAPELTTQQLQAINGMLAGCSFTKLAKEIGVNRTTLLRWRKNPVFSAALSDAKAELHSHMHLRLESVADSLVDVLQKAIVNPEAFAYRNPELVFHFLQKMTGSALMHAEPVKKDM